MPEGRANPECGAGSSESLDDAVLPGVRVLILVNEQEAMAVTKDPTDFPKVKKSGSVVQGVILREPSRSRLLLIDSPPVPLQELAECIHYGLMTTDELTEEVSQVLGHPELG